MSERNPDGFDWTWLRDFAAVAEGGSLSAAARRLGVSQPTLTRRVAALEAHLGSEVLHRGPRGIQLTEIGETLLPAVRRIIDQNSLAVGIAVDLSAPPPPSGERARWLL